MTRERLVTGRCPGQARSSNFIPRAAKGADGKLSHGAFMRSSLGETKSDPVRWSFSTLPVYAPSLPVVQPYPTAGRVDDPLEREADRIADVVLSMPEAAGAQASRLPDAVSAVGGNSGLQRACAACAEEEEVVQAKKTSNSDMAAILPGLPRSELSGASGRALPPSVRAFFEPRFGADFASVRIHDGETASRLAASINARAFTMGRDLVFGAGQYRPDAVSGRRLLAHELTHVLQQGKARGAVRGLAATRSSSLSGAAAPGLVQAQMDSPAPSPLGLLSQSICPATRVTWLKREAGGTAYEYFRVSAGTKACTVRVVFEEHDDPDANRFYDLLKRASRDEIRVCVEFEGKLGDPDCDTPRDVENVTVA